MLTEHVKQDLKMIGKDRSKVLQSIECAVKKVVFKRYGVNLSLKLHLLRAVSDVSSVA